MTAVSVDGVHVRFGANAVLRDVNFDLGAGEVVCLAGRNGAGKSTLLRAIGGLHEPSHGTVTVFGRPHRHQDARKEIAYLANPPALYPNLTTYEHMRLLAALWKSNVDVSQLIADSGLGSLADTTPEEMSLGQSQRLSLSLLDISRPSLWLLDEPFNGLDAEASHDLYRKIEEIRESGGTVLVATHLVEAVAPLVTRLLWLEAGTVIVDRPIERDLMTWIHACLAGEHR